MLGRSFLVAQRLIVDRHVFELLDHRVVAYAVTVSENELRESEDARGRRRGGRNRKVGLIRPVGLRRDVTNYGPQWWGRAGSDQVWLRIWLLSIHDMLALRRMESSYRRLID